MKQEKFIQEEIRSVIKQELTEILTNGLQSSIDELKESKKIESKQTNIKSVTNNKVKFQKNKFSDILNETNKLTENKSSADYASLMNEDIVMTSKDAQGFGMRRSIDNNTSIMQDPESGKSLKVDPVIQKAMTRDYSSLMKAIDKKKGNGVPV